MIGVTGATGHLGRMVIGRVKTTIPAGQLVALVRSPQKAADLGVPVRQADYDKPDTLERALEAIEVLLLISASEIGKRIPQHHNIITAARAAGVRHIVYTSLLRADTSPISLAEEHRATEEELKASGMTITLLRNGWYTENYTGSIPGAVAGGAFLGCAGDGRIASAAREDYADAAAAVLTGQGHDGKTYELAGDEAFTLSELAAEISRQTGKTIPYRNLSEAEYARALVGFGLAEPVAQAIAGWDVAASDGALFDDGYQLSKLIGRPTTPIAAMVADALQ